MSVAPRATWVSKAASVCPAPVRAAALLLANVVWRAMSTPELSPVIWAVAAVAWDALARPPAALPAGGAAAAANNERAR